MSTVSDWFPIAWLLPPFVSPSSSPHLSPVHASSVTVRLLDLCTFFRLLFLPWRIQSPVQACSSNEVLSPFRFVPPSLVGSRRYLFSPLFFPRGIPGLFPLLPVFPLRRPPPPALVVVCSILPPAPFCRQSFSSSLPTCIPCCFLHVRVWWQNPLSSFVPSPMPYLFSNPPRASSFPPSAKNPSFALYVVFSYPCPPS